MRGAAEQIHHPGPHVLHRFDGDLRVRVQPQHRLVKHGQVGPAQRLHPDRITGGERVVQLDRLPLRLSRPLRLDGSLYRNRPGNRFVRRLGWNSMRAQQRRQEAGKHHQAKRIGASPLYLHHAADGELRQSWTSRACGRGSGRDLIRSHGRRPTLSRFSREAVFMVSPCTCGPQRCACEVLRCAPKQVWKYPRPWRASARHAARGQELRRAPVDKTPPLRSSRHPFVLVCHAIPVVPNGQ
jgi:hypothetical protein